MYFLTFDDVTGYEIWNNFVSDDFFQRVRIPGESAYPVHAQDKSAYWVRSNLVDTAKTRDEILAKLALELL